MQGHIFLNSSLTEAFGIGILEAACCGLFIVSTRVGGVPEILPDGMISFAEPDTEGECLVVQCTWSNSTTAISTDLVRALDVGIRHVKSDKHDVLTAHKQVRQMYSWSDVAERTEKVYRDVLEAEPPTMVERLQR